MTVSRYYGVVIALLAISTLTGIGNGCAKASHPNGGTVGPERGPSMDQQRAGRVPVVLRVKYEKFIGGQKYAWDEVSVIETLKNNSNRPFSGPLQIGHYGWEPGIPHGECTVYLEEYVEGDTSRWKLLGGSAKEGVSHATEIK